MEARSQRSSEKRLQMTIQNDSSGHSSIVGSQAAMNLMRDLFGMPLPPMMLCTKMNDRLTADETNLATTR